MTYPLYATYMKLFGLLLTSIFVVISSSFFIHVILKSKELKNNNILLITDIICTVMLCCLDVLLIVQYLANINIYHNCNTITPIVGWLTMSTCMMILPPAVHRFISVAQPFTHHKEEDHSNDNSTMGYSQHFYISVITKLCAVYVSLFGGCAILSNLELVPLLILIIYVSPYLSYHICCLSASQNHTCKIIYP